MIVTPATVADIPRIREIQKQHLIILNETKDLNARMKNGFFVTEVSEDKFRARITDAKRGLVLVARNNGQISGYAFAYDLNCIRREEPHMMDTIEIMPTYQNYLNGQRILYVDQIAKDAEAGGRVGSALMTELEMLAKRQEYATAAGLVMDRRLLNMASVRLLFKFEYERIGTQTLEQDAWGVFVKELGKP